MENKNELSLTKIDALGTVTSKIAELQKGQKIVLPHNYSSENAINSAWLKLQEVKDKSGKPALECCSKSSITESLYNMVLQGLSPAKNQCYFVVYGNQLKLMRSYMGTVAVTKRLKGIKDIKAYCIYDGDEFEETFDLETATLKVTKYKPSFENIDSTKIKGAFAVVVGENGPIHTEVMSMNQIKMAWSKSKTGGQVHKDFAEEMAKKTVINRACKMYANTSDDSDLLIEAFNNSDERNFDEQDMVQADYEVKEEIKTKANKKEIDIDDTQKAEKVEAEEVKPIKEEKPGQQVIDIDPGF